MSPIPIDLPEGAVPGERPFRYPAALPERPWTGKWMSAAPAQLGFDPVGLRRSADEIGRMEGVYSLLVVRNGYLATERYFREGYREKPHNLKSASKSVLSALVGIAVDEGLLSLDQPICPLLPQCDRLDDPRKARITVWQLLTMTSGLAPTSYDAYGTWTANGDWVRNALDQPLEADPGTRYAYSTGDTHVLSAVLTAATGKSTYDWAVEKLFDPMDITVHGWSTDPRGIYQGGNNLSLTPRDMAKIGLMYLSGGTFGGRRIVPEWWVEVSTRDGRWDDHPVYGRYKYLWYAGTQRQGRIRGRRVRGAIHLCVAAPQLRGGRHRHARHQGQGVGAASVRTHPGRHPGKLCSRSGPRAAGRRHQRCHRRAVPCPRRPRRGRGERGCARRLARQTEEDLPGAAGEDNPDLPLGETTNNVVLRSGPTQESLRLEIVPAGQRVEILDTQGPWHLVLYDGKAGWLHGDYVNLLQRPAAPNAGPTLAEVSSDGAENPVPQEGEVRGWTRTRLKLRSGPSLDDTVLTTLDEGSPLVIEKKAGSWLAVSTGSLSGWVHADYVRLEPEDAETLARAPDEGPSGAAPETAGGPGRR